MPPYLNKFISSCALLDLWKRTALSSARFADIDFVDMQLVWNHGLAMQGAMIVRPTFFKAWLFC